MDEMASTHLQRRPARRQSGEVGKLLARGSVALAVQGLLAASALCGGAAETLPTARQESTPTLAQAPNAGLKNEYLRCDRISSQQRLALDAAIYCGAVGDELLKREFDGDFDRLLAWWRGARQAPGSYQNTERGAP